MASAITTRSAIDSALKIIYAGPLHNDIVSDSELMDLFETEMAVQQDITTGGRYVEMAHFFRLPAGVGARGENEYLPEADDPLFVNSRVYLRKVLGTIEMTGDTMDRVKDDEGAFLDYADRALPALAERVANEMDRMYVGTGKGIKARIAAITVVGTTATVTVDRAMGVTGLTDAWLQFLDGERIVVTADAGGQTVRVGGGVQSAQVTDLNEDAGTITVVGNATLLAAWTVNDYIFAGDEAGISSMDATPANRELQGLLAGVDDGNIIATYNNIDRTAAGNRLWKSVVVDSSAVPFSGEMSEDLLIHADDYGYVRGMAKVDTIVMSRSAVRGYWKSLKGDRFFLDPRGSYTGGKANPLQVVLGDRTLALKVARKLPPEVAFGLSRDTWRRLSLGAWKWDDTTGSIWNRVTDGTGRKHAFYASGLMYEELLCFAPRRNWRIDNLVVSQ